MRVVIKVGTSTLAHKGGRLNIRRVELLCKVLSDLKNAGHQIVLVCVFDVLVISQRHNVRLIFELDTPLEEELQFDFDGIEAGLCYNERTFRQGL